MPDKYFYHPERRVWATVKQPSQEVLDNYPEGTVEIAPPPGAGYLYTGSVWIVDPDYAAEVLEAERAKMVVSRFQAKAALSVAGLLAGAEAAVAGADAMTQLAWAEAIEFRRNSPTIAALAGALSLTDTDLDDLFRAAALIEA